MDPGSSQSADLADPAGLTATSIGAKADAKDLSSQTEAVLIPEAVAKDLVQTADLRRTGLSDTEFGEILYSVGQKHNFGLPAGTEATATQREQFWRSLHLHDLALAHACARGIEAAWEEFLREHRAPMRQAAAAITRSTSEGEELADSLYSDLFGLKEREGARWSPLESYSGRGPLMGWLRATLAQRHVNHYRRTHRENPLEGDDFAAPASDPPPQTETLERVSAGVRKTLRDLSVEDRFLLSAYFLDGRTLAELAALMRVHLATVSRRIGRLTKDVHKKLLKELEVLGMSRQAAREALGMDPRDLNLNLRNLLQNSTRTAFPEQRVEGEAEDGAERARDEHD